MTTSSLTTWPVPTDTGRAVTVHGPWMPKARTRTDAVPKSLLPATKELCRFLAGFHAGEGCFSGSAGNRFCLEVGLGSLDRGMCEGLQNFLEVGHVYDSPRRKDHYDDEVNYVVQSLQELIDVFVPFMDARLPPSYKSQ